MNETGVDLEPILAGLERLGPSDRGRRLGVFEAQADQGAAALARDLIRAGIAAGQPALLVDVGLDGAGEQLAWFTEAGAQEGLSPGKARDGRVRGHSFVRTGGDDAQPPLVLRQLGDARAYLIHPNAQARAGAVRFQPNADPAFWTAAGEIAALTVVSAPPICVAPDGLSFAEHLDGVILVVSAQTGSVRAALHAARLLAAARAGLLGIVYTDADPGLLRLEQAWPVWAA
jgi:fructose-specific component phosphotransferase system IIB-like protein